MTTWMQVTAGSAGVLAAGLSVGWWQGPHRWEAATARMRDRLEMGICTAIDLARVNGNGAPRICNTTNIGFRGLQSEAILLLMSEAGICASAGAACSSGSLEPSHVLIASTHTHSGTTAGSETSIGPSTGRGPEDIAAIVASGTPVFAIAEDLQVLGIRHEPHVEGVRVLPRADLPKLFEQYEQIWQW